LPADRRGEPSIAHVISTMSNAVSTICVTRPSLYPGLNCPDASLVHFHSGCCVTLVLA
jgi:hypothetical protein